MEATTRSMPSNTFLPETLLVIQYANDHSYLVSSEPYLIKLDQHIRDLKAFGLWDKFDLLYWMVGDGDMDFKTINIIDPDKYKGVLSGGLINTLQGTDGNGVDGRISTNFNPTVQVSKYEQDEAGRGAYVYNAVASTIAGGIIEGIAPNPTYNMLKIRNNTDSKINGSNLTNAVDLTGTGYTSINRIDADTVVLYKETTEYIDLTCPSTTVFFNSYQVIHGAGTAYSSNGISCYWISSSITGQDAANHRLSIVDNLAIDVDPPTVVFDEIYRTISASHSLGTSELLVSVDDEPYEPYVGPIEVGDSFFAAGYYKFKIKAAVWRNESPVADSPEIAANSFLPETRLIIQYADDHSYLVSSEPYLVKLDQYIRDLKSAGLWGKFDLMYWMVGDGDMDFKTINIIDPDVYKGTVVDLFNTSRGIRGNAQGRILTHFKPATAAGNYTQDDAGRGAYVYANDFTTTSGGIIDGIEDNATYNILKARNNTESKINGSANLSVTADLTGSDYLGINRTDANTVVLYQGLNEYVDNTNPSTLTFFDSNQTILGASSARGGNAISCYWIGGSITGGDATSLRQLILDNNSILPNENTTPPTIIKDDIARTLTATSPYGESEITVSISFQPYQQYTGPIHVGNGAVPANFYRFRIKESVGYEESSSVNGGSFPEIPDDVPAPTNGIVDNINKTFGFTPAEGYEDLSNYLYTINGGLTWSQVINNPFYIGNKDIEVGYIEVKTIDRGREEFSKEILYNQDPFTYTEVIKDSTAKPTGVIGDNVNRTFSFDVAPGLTLDDYEFCYEYNVSRIWRPIASNPQPLNVSWGIGSGEIAVRVKETDDRWASEPSFVNLAYPEKTPSVAAPTLIIDQDLRIIDFRHPLGMWARDTTAQAYRRVGTKIASGSFNNVRPPIEVPNDNVASGYYQFRFTHCRSTDCTSNGIALAPAFPIITTTPSAPILIANDVSNTLSAWHPLGDSEILVSINDSAYSAYTGVISVDNVDRPLGYYKFKTKSATNRNESSVVSSPAFTADTTGEILNYTLNLTLA